MNPPVRNYQKELDALIEFNTREGIVPSLLLHSCCGPCSSSVLEYLTRYFSVTVFYYNPNIYPSGEYFRRLEEQKMLLSAMWTLHPVRLVEGAYETQRYYHAVQGLEDAPEGGERCWRCYALRLEEAALLARREGFDCFTTTLTVSPHKNSLKLNEIGMEMAEKYGVRFLNSDFKKKNGYRRSLELSAQYGLYRQDYCGCEFSRRNRPAKKTIEASDV